jgi:NAD(P)-dependent dehydrogenase (short-subunit alcohol dehydrogenase family)
MSGMLEGKAALVTGGGRGIGRSTALLFAREDARVVVADLSSDGARETAELIAKAGGEALSVVADISKPADVSSMMVRRSALSGSSIARSTTLVSTALSPVSEAS